MNKQITFSRHPNSVFNFGRINILLGANGTGKTKTLQELRDKAGHFYSGQNLIYVEGGRTISLPETLINRHPGMRNQMETIAGIEERHKTQRHQTLVSRIAIGLQLLEKKGQEIKEEHSDKVAECESKGRSGQAPIREEPPLNVLFKLFNEVFPAIKLSLDSKNKKIDCSKNGSANYNLQSLSDGEKQVLSILLDISILAKPNSLILVDEPELNLNPFLATKVWETIENDLPDCVFVYTTHDVGFGMRSNIETVFVLSNENEQISEVKKINEINPNDLRLLLGSIPAILSTNSALVTEGKPNSFDTIFYRWILGTTTIETVPMGSGADVVAVSNRTGIWDAIAPTVSIKGVIDRDFKSDEILESFSSPTTTILDFHEAESYLCIPSIVKMVSETIGLIETPSSLEEIEKVIRKEFEQNILKISGHRVFDRTTIKLSVSIQKKVLSEFSTKTELEEKLLEGCNDQREFAEQHLNEEKIKGFLNLELENCKKALDDNDINTMLRLTPGKSLIAKILPLTGARNISDYARACAKHIKVESVPELKSLQEKLTK